MANIQHTGEQLACPHCGAKQSDNVEDYVVPGKLGAASACTDVCEYCSDEFEVCKLSENEFKVYE